MITRRSESFPILHFCQLDQCTSHSNGSLFCFCFLNAHKLRKRKLEMNRESRSMGFEFYQFQKGGQATVESPSLLRMAAFVPFFQLGLSLYSGTVFSWATDSLHIGRYCKNPCCAFFFSCVLRRQNRAEQLSLAHNRSHLSHVMCSAQQLKKNTKKKTRPTTQVVQRRSFAFPNQNSAAERSRIIITDRNKAPLFIELTYLLLGVLS